MRNAPEEQKVSDVCSVRLRQERQWKGAEGDRTDSPGLSSAGGTGADRVPRLGSEGTHQCSDHWPGEAEDGAHQKDVR